jgi:TolB-like protein/Tfp pilus assembly protein PilF
MSSIIEGYNFEIFISYRQKDNKGDRWVSEFVEALKTELESTFKEEVGVYFDINPHSGLLETHDVDASLKEKLKCLVFIPIISRTYCDPKSFAWENEFKTFVEQASQDQFGLKVKLPNGNVTSRVLPVRIHDLDTDDVNLFESVIGGTIRTMDFVFKTASGVNRPLKYKEDHPGDNLNKTYYQDQINKVALAIKEIILGLKREPDPIMKVKPPFKGSIDEDKKDDIRVNVSSRSFLNPKSKKWLIILLSILLCVAGTFALLKIIEGTKQAEDISKLEKSIAVLPFVNDSPDQENTYFINGIMEEIINNLQKINDFRVIPRTSVEHYRDADKPSIPKIAKDLNVNYILQGSGQKYGSKFVLKLQLLVAKHEKQLWGGSFELEILETSDIINLQSQIAQKIATELKGTITPEVRQLIEKIPTTNLTAYDFCLRGDDELNKFWYKDNYGNTQALDNAEKMYRKALEYDSTYAQAYVGLASIYIGKHQDDSYLADNYLDSMLILSNLALSFDDKLSSAYGQKAVYYFMLGKSDQEKKELELAIKFSPNPGWEYWRLGQDYYLYSNIDYVKGLESYYKVLSFTHGMDLPIFLPYIGNAYGYFTGFPEKAKNYFKEVLQIDRDTSVYLGRLAGLEINSRNYEKAFELINKCYSMDSLKFENICSLASIYYLQGNYKESLRYFMKVVDKYETLSPSTAGGFRTLGYVYWMNGYKKESVHWFEKEKIFNEVSIRLGRVTSIDKSDYYNLAALYAFTGEKQKAYVNLKKFAKIRICPWAMLTSIKTDPFFDSIRNESEFQLIVKDLEAKYQAEHERVRIWMEQKGML